MVKSRVNLFPQEKQNDFASPEAIAKLLHDIDLMLTTGRNEYGSLQEQMNPLIPRI